MKNTQLSHISAYCRSSDWPRTTNSQRLFPSRRVSSPLNRDLYARPFRNEFGCPVMKWDAEESGEFSPTRNFTASISAPFRGPSFICGVLFCGVALIRARSLSIDNTLNPGAGGGGREGGGKGREEGHQRATEMSERNRSFPPLLLMSSFRAPSSLAGGKGTGTLHCVLSLRPPDSVRRAGP